MPKRKGVFSGKSPLGNFTFTSNILNNFPLTVASLENCNETSAEFFCPVKMCFEFACEANFRFSFRYCPKWDFFCEILFYNVLISCCRKATIPEYKREYEEIEIRFDKLGFLCIYIEFDGVNYFEKRRMFASYSILIDVSNIWKWNLVHLMA